MSNEYKDWLFDEEQEFPGSLHNHTDYSNLKFRDSINTVPGIIDYAIELGHKCIAITEHDCISSSIVAEDYYDKIKEKYPDFKIILGNEIYLVRNDLTADNFIVGKDKYYHFILLAKDAIGHQQIRELSTRAWLRSYVSRNQRRVPTYYRDLEEIIGVNPGHVIASTACFLPGQKVKTKNGEKNIEDINELDYILNNRGEWEKINFPTKRFYSGKGNLIKITREPLEIKCTEDHKFLCYDSKQKTLEWKEAKFLQKNDKLVEPILSPEYSNKTELDINEFNTILEYRKFSKGSSYIKSIFRIPNKIKISNELMRTFGLWLADGHISMNKEKNKYAIGFTFSINEFDNYYKGFVQQGLKDLGLSEKDYCINKREKNNRVDLYINKVEICLLFYEIFGLSHAKNKFIPKRLKNINLDLDLELFFGYMLGDGYFRYRQSRSGEIVAASISKQLTKDFEQLGIDLELSGSITISNSRKDKNGVYHQESYYLTYNNIILGKELNKTEIITHEQLKDIFLRAKNKKKQFIDFITIDNIKYRIKKVKSNTQFNINEYVYCLNTKSHNFVLNNVVVHNCLGSYLSTNLLEYHINKSEELYQKIIKWCNYIISIFGKDNFYLEMQPSAYNEQEYVNLEILELSKKLNIPYIITTDSHYMKKEDAPIHEAYLNSQDGDREVKSFYATTYMMDTQELESYMNGYLTKENFRKAYHNILEIREKCENYSLKKPLKIPQLKWKIPEVEVIEDKWFSAIPNLRKFYESDCKGDNILARAIVQAIEKSPEELENEKTFAAVDDCLDKTWESSIVNKTHWSYYFLNLQNIVEECWNAGTIVGAGRGSGVGFILLYLLDIIQINALRENTQTFSFRFLNPARVSVLD